MSSMKSYRVITVQRAEHCDYHDSESGLSDPGRKARACRCQAATCMFGVNEDNNFSWPDIELDAIGGTSRWTLARPKAGLRIKKMVKHISGSSHGMSLK